MEQQGTPDFDCLENNSQAPQKITTTEQIYDAVMDDVYQSFLHVKGKVLEKLMVEYTQELEQHYGGKIRQLEQRIAVLEKNIPCEATESLPKVVRKPILKPVPTAEPVAEPVAEPIPAPITEQIPTPITEQIPTPEPTPEPIMEQIPASEPLVEPENVPPISSVEAPLVTDSPASQEDEAQYHDYEYDEDASAELEDGEFDDDFDVFFPEENNAPESDDSNG